MTSLLGDRFLKKYVGEIRRKQKNSVSITEGPNADADGDEVVIPSKNAAEEINEVDAAASLETKQSSNENNSEVDNG